ncbi:hypothetical protein M885DRAFT_510646 [Pelagophyceae sp. CCMP2097]|nr:hypothetical protein M885DRAFT_510646 [Pelagophyceae sp. CCMP2097]|mmetsp:Transcript_27753/g.93265  ORF Transcript_27753/g.93265 Transcript_27753/m.93265 type:complete len:216 (-) Transcript_27753:28-675(-)
MYALLLAVAAVRAVAVDGPSEVKLTLTEGAHAERAHLGRSGLARLEFCSSCDDPETEGFFELGLTALQGVREYRLTSTIVYAVPNDASKILNAAELRGKIALCDRGGNVPLVQKILAVQQAGSIGVVLVDDGQCTDLDCGRVGSKKLGGFAAKDDPVEWRKVKIPAVLVSTESGARLQRLMPLDRFTIPKVGPQWINKQQQRTKGAHKGKQKRDL